MRTPRRAGRPHGLLLLACLWGAGAAAAPVGPDAVREMLAGWVAAEPEPLGVSLGAGIRAIELIPGGLAGPLGYAVEFESGGLVLAAADDEIEPVLAFAARGRFDPAANHPLSVLVRADLEARRARLGATGSEGGTAAPASRAADAWRRLRALGRAGAAGVHVARVPDLRAGPLVQSAWDQKAEGGAYDYCYNTFTPRHYPCGCVATALAQLMRYHRHPVQPVGTRRFWVTVEQDPTPYQQFSLRGGDGAGGAYAWDAMALDPDAGTPDAARRAIGALCFDAGLAIGMRYGPLSSSADVLYSLDALRGVFGYANGVRGWNDGAGLPGADFLGMVTPSLDAGCPVVLAIWGPGGGHAVLCDGYGFLAGTLYHHLNMGWGARRAAENVWYALPGVDAVLSFDTINGCLYNLFPSGAGEIISGRIADALGHPIAGAVVTADRAGGGRYQAASNRRGVYALRGVPAESQFTLSVVRAGFRFAPRLVATGRSRDYHSVSGSRAGMDFIGTGARAAEPVVYPVMGDPGAGVADLGLYDDGAGCWRFRSGSGAAGLAFGVEDCQPIYADLDGDRRADPGLYHDGWGLWAVRLSSRNDAVGWLAFGLPGSHPAAADVDGDRLADPILYQEAAGLWHARLSASGYAAMSAALGAPGGRPAPADYDGDRLADPAVFRAESGAWHAWLSTRGYQPVSLSFGTPSDAPAAGDSDGDGKADPAVYNVVSGQWTLLQSSRRYAPMRLTFF